MDKQKIFAEKIKDGSVVKRIELGVAILDDGRISASKYNSLKRIAFKNIGSLKKGAYFNIVTEDGREDKFGGYPAFSFVRFL